jgi:superfamily II helicase
LTGKIPVNGKLTTYLFLKTNFKLEKYLTLVKKYEYRKSICKLRTSAYRLFIETGRYTNIPRNERICKNCANQEIEDETHFLTRCQKFSGERDDLFNSISIKVKIFTNLSDKTKLFCLLNCENQEILNSVGRFLYQNMP